ncbi:hypothetical protein KAW18_03800 [candidate division WOR-3 bacterium]|nr:hypothetical protein [Candidatus Parcubacteria bacterium]MCK4526471.1 hypothetical protein [candidate division WOR-3 bacterium]
MANRMTTHATHELIMSRILTKGFKVFKKLNMEFNEEQIKTLKGYLKMLLDENERRLKEDNDQVLTNNKKFHDYANILLYEALDLTIDLTTTSFINWGVALYYRNMIDMLKQKN